MSDPINNVLNTLYINHLVGKMFTIKITTIASITTVTRIIIIDLIFNKTAKMENMHESNLVRVKFIENYHIVIPKLIIVHYYNH